MTQFITKGKGAGRKVIPMKASDTYKKYTLQKAKVKSDIQQLKDNKQRLKYELMSAKTHIQQVMADSGHTIKLLELDLVQLKKDKKLVVVAKIKDGTDTYQHIIDNVVLKEHMLAKDFNNIIESIKTKYHKTVAIWK